MRKRKTGFKAKYLCKAKFKSQAPHNQAPHNLALQIRLRHAVWAFGKCSASVPKNGDRCTNPGELFNFELLRLNMPRKSHCGHHHFPRDIIPCAVQWRLRYSLPYQSRTMRDRMSGSACGGKPSKQRLKNNRGGYKGEGRIREGTLSFFGKVKQLHFCRNRVMAIT